MVNKVCKTCKKTKNVLDFPIHSRKEDKIYYRSQCKLCWCGSVKHIDHIIPQSSFKFSSMNDVEFKKCWSLDNLWPYSAKQNCKDNARMQG